MTLLLHLADFNERRWADGFAAALPGRRVVTRDDPYDPAEIDYIFIWRPKPDAFEGLTNLKAVLSLGAGVDALLRHPALPKGVPIVRFMDAPARRDSSIPGCLGCVLHGSERRSPSAPRICARDAISSLR